MITRRCIMQERYNTLFIDLLLRTLNPIQQVSQYRILVSAWP
jgi:hypothetical protein